MELFERRRWSGFCPLRFETLPKAPVEIGLKNPEFVVRSAPVRHWIPAQALRIESRTEGAVVVYLWDTGPSEQLVTLSRCADLLLHKAAGLESGHSSGEQAAAIADQNGVNRLWLIHYDPSADRKALRVRAQSTFSGLVEVAEDGTELVL